LCVGVAVVGGFGEGLGGPNCPDLSGERGGGAVGGALVGGSGDGGGGGVHFEAAAVSAGAGRAVGIDGGVACFARHSGGSIPYFAIENDAVADSGAEGEHAEGGDVHGAAAAEDALGESGGV